MTAQQRGKAPNNANADLIRLAAEIGAKTALETLEKERQKQYAERHKRKLHNTKLLLRNFRMFKAHSDCAVSELQELDEDTYQVFEMMMSDSVNDSNLFVESIKKSVARTKIIVTHVGEMLDLYFAFCQNSNKIEDMRRYRVIEAMYISCDEQPTASQIAEREGIDDRTVYKDIDAAIEKLSALIFGIDGIKCK